GTLTTPALDLSDATNVVLALNHHYRRYIHSYAAINISTDGMEWTTAYEFWSSEGGASFPLVEYDITDLAAGEEEVYIQFLYSDGFSWEWYWIIDQVTVYEPDTELPDNAIQIGHDNITDLNLPFWPDRRFSFSQNIYLQSEINNEAWITDIFYYWDGGDEGAGCKDWVIYMGHTDKTGFIDDSDWLPVDDMIKVFDGEVNLSIFAGWIQIPLDLPFSYNNIDNLVIAVDQNTFGLSTGRFFGSETPESRGIIYYNNWNNPDPEDPPTATTLVSGIANLGLQLSETAPDPIPVLEPEYLQFGPVAVDESSDTLSVVVKNFGGQLIIDGMEIIGDDPDEFEIVSSHYDYIIIPSYDSITVVVAFIPSSTGIKNAILEFDNSSITGPVAQVPLQGLAIPVDPPEIFTAAAAGATSILLEWEKNQFNNDVIIAHNLADEFGEPIDGQAYEVGDELPGGGTIIYIGAAESFLHEEVAANTGYFYKAWSMTENKNYSFSVETYGTPLCTITYDIPFFENFHDVPEKQMPVCWSTIIETNEGRNHWIGGGSESAFIGLTFYNDWEPDPTLIAITPALNADINNLFIEFFAVLPARGSGEVTEGITIGVISDPEDLNTFEPLETFDLEQHHIPEKITYYFHQYNGNAQHVALKANFSWVTLRYIHVFNVLIDSRPSCMPPLEMEADNITLSSADISWDPGHEENQWYLKYGPRGFDPSSVGTTVPITWDPAYTIENLSHSTQYDVYVQARCGSNDLSELTGPLTFTTLCMATPDPIVEDFDTTPEGELPICWSSIYDDNSNIETSAEYPFSEPHSLVMFKSAMSPDGIILVSPELDNDIQSLYLKFFAKNAGWGGAPVLEMGTMTDPADAETFTLIHSFNINSEWEQHFYLFDDYTGSDQHIAFRVSIMSARIALDDIIIEVFDECLRPVAFHAVSAEATSVLLDWIPGYNEENWDIMYGLPGFSPGAGGIGIKYADHHPFTLDGLEPATTYDVYLRSYCGMNDLSPWVGPLSVKTLPCYDEDRCVYTVQLITSQGNGWNGNVLGFRQDGFIVATFGEDFTDGSEFGPVETPICPDEQTEIVIVNLGIFTNRIGFSVYDPGGGLVFQRDPGEWFTSDPVFYTFYADCGSEVPGVPDFLEINNETAGSGQEICYNAKQTITVAGSGSTFIVENGGTATLIAGHNIIMLPGTTVHHGGNLHAWITTDDSYCENLPPVVAQHFDNTEDIRLEDQLITTGRRQSLLIYPNPTTGNLTLEIPETAEESTLIIEIYNMIGESILQKELPVQHSYKIDLTGRQPGMYIVRVVRGQEMDFVKVIKK
ncbi:MAG: T9SS C-terminal target domain-containing protein, partial [Balneolaceae bacterium]